MRFFWINLCTHELKLGFWNKINIACMNLYVSITCLIIASKDMKVVHIGFDDTDSPREDALQIWPIR